MCYEVDNRSRLASSSCSIVGGGFFPSCELALQCVPPWPSLLLNCCVVGKAVERSCGGVKARLDVCRRRRGVVAHEGYARLKGWFSGSGWQRSWVELADWFD